MKRIILILTITLLSMTALPVLAELDMPLDPTQPAHFNAEPPGEDILFDALILRPLGLASMAIGAGTAVVAFPWSISSNSEDRVANGAVAEALLVHIRPAARGHWLLKALT